MLVVDLDEWTAAHAAAAIRAHRGAMRRGGHPVPGALADLEQALTAAAKRGQSRTVPAVPDVSADAAPMNALTLTYDQAATLLGRSARTVRRMVDRGDLEAVRVGGRRMVRRADVERLAEQGASA